MLRGVLVASEEYRTTKLMSPQEKHTQNPKKHCLSHLTCPCSVVEVGAVWAVSSLPAVTVTVRICNGNNTLGLTLGGGHRITPRHQGGTLAAYRVGHKGSEHTHLSA